MKAPRSLQGAIGRRLTLSQHLGPRGSPLDLPSKPQAGPPTGAGGGVEARPQPPPPPVSPAPTCSHPASARTHSASCLPAAIKPANEKDELCTTPGCVMAGKPRPHLPWPCPGAGLPRRWAGPETGGGREGQDGGAGLPRWTRDGRRPRDGAQASGRGALGLVDRPRTRPCSGWRKQARARVLPAPTQQASPACSGPCPRWTQGLSSAFILERRPRKCTPAATFCPRAFS